MITGFSFLSSVSTPLVFPIIIAALSVARPFRFSICKLHCCSFHLTRDAKASESALANFSRTFGAERNVILTHEVTGLTNWMNDSIWDSTTMSVTSSTVKPKLWTFCTLLTISCFNVSPKTRKISRIWSFGPVVEVLELIHFKGIFSKLD